MPISIVNEKKKIINNILAALAVLGTIVVFFAFLRDVSIHFSIVNTGINLFAVLILYILLVAGNKIDHEKKAWVIILIFVVMGSKSMIVNGHEGYGFNFLLFSSMIAIMIFKKRKVFVVVMMSSLSYLVITTLFIFDIIEPQIAATESLDNYFGWVMEITFFIFLLFIIIVGVGRMHKSFTLSIQELNESNQKLNQYNEELRNQLEYTREMENKVAEKEVNFKRLFEESNDGIIVCDADGRIIEANTAITTLLNYPKSFLIGNPSANFVTSDDKRAINQLSIDKIHRAKIRELHVLGKDGSRIPVEVSYSVINFNEEKSILVTIRDIRERKQTEQKVLSAVIQAEENERSRFAKDLHDDLGPILSSIKMYIQSLRQHEDSNDKKDLINRLVTTVDDSIKSIRKISYNLSSHLLQNMGLVNALKTHVERINLSSTFRVNLYDNFEDEVRLPSNVEIVTYRVLLELINNSITHSKGDTIDINLILNENQFVIIYSDNGIGFDIDKMLHDNSKGIGLKNILSRIKSIKGMINFENDKRGFSLAIDINL